MERDSVSLPDDSNKKCTGSAHCFSLAGCGRGLSVRATDGVIRVQGELAPEHSAENVVA